MRSEDRNRLSAVKRKIEETQALMIAYVTGERTPDQPVDYQELYYQLDVELEDLGYPNPNPHRSLEVFWSFCKLEEMGTYASRRAYVRELYADVLLEIERTVRRAKDPRRWKKANQQLTDELAPVRRQWLKAKNFIYSPSPDYENSIKESINAIESALKILTGDSKSTLGKLLKQIDIDKDIKRILSQAYGLVSNKPFVRHGGTQAEHIGKEEAEFFIELAATAIIYLKSKLQGSVELTD
jgi:hypothetical protein